MNSVNEMSKKSAQSEQNVLFNNRTGSLVPLNDQAGSSAMILNNQAGSPSAVPLNDGASSSVALKDQAGPSSVPMNNHEGPLPTVEGNTGQRDRKSPVLKKGTWTPAEDDILVEYVRRNGEGNWNSVHKKSGLMRCGKSCRLRWTNHLSPNLKKGIFSAREEKLLVELHAMVGNKWSRMSTFFHGRTDNELKNYWNTRARRCMRANLPIYPPKVLEALKENWQPDNDLACPLSIYNIDIPIDPTPVDNQDIVFREPAGPNNPFCSMLNQVPNLSQNPNFMPTTMHQLDMVVPPQESVTYIPPFRYGGNYINLHSSLTTPYTPLQQSENPAHYSANPEAPNVFVKNFPASPPGLLRGELPSLQYPDPGYWSSSSSQLPPLPPVTTFAPPPPPSWLLQSDSSLQMNSVLLDALLHQSHNLSTRNMAFIKNLNSCVVEPGDKGKSSMPSFNNMQWNGYDGFVPSFGHPAMPFNQHVPASIGSWNDQVAPTTFVPAAPVLDEGVPAGVGSWNGQVAATIFGPSTSVNNSDSEPASVGFWNGQVAPSTFVPGYHAPQGGNEYVAPNGWQAEVPTQQNVWNVDSFMNMGWDEIAAQINDPSFLSDDLPRLLREDSFNGHHQQTVAGRSTPNQGWVGASTSNQGFVEASTSNQGWQDASTSNQGAVNNQELGSSSYMWNNNGIIDGTRSVGAFV